jgi:antitoxin component YwqK of YwqJK toxin-antitoxin module
MKSVLNLILLFVLTGCGINNHSDGVMVLSSQEIRPIKVMLRDSIYYQINFDTSGSISSILPYRSGVLEGYAYELYRNGNLKRRMELHSGRLNGIAQYFHESGTLWKQIFFKRELQDFSKIVYWDSLFPVVRYIYESDTSGIVTKIKTFNRQGTFLKDSFPLKGEQIFPE